ncbi:MAG TPA: hypothetical protein VNA20_17350 [Frankiaceae bacterium]|nr:hypothetical protein [Frankiaceae bacterium]
MRRLALALVLATSALAAPAAPATADPGSAVLVLDVTVGCFGCGTYGPAGNSIDGSVVVGHGPLRTGARVTGTFTINGGCFGDATATGTLTSDGYGAGFTWIQAGAPARFRIDGFGSGGGGFAIESPRGIPCGTMVRGRLTVAVSHSSDPASAGGQSSPSGEIAIYSVPGGSYAISWYGAFATGYWCDRDATYTTEVVAYCRPVSSSPPLRCAGIQAVSRVSRPGAGSSSTPSTGGR